MTQLEQDAVQVLKWFITNAGKYVTYRDIASGVGIPRGARLERTVRAARAAAENLGHCIEDFLPSRDPRHRGAYTTRLTLAEEGDEHGARAAMHTVRRGVTSMRNMRRACAYEAKNQNGIAPKAFQEMTTAVEGCIQTVSGVGELGQEVYRLQSEKDALARRVAELEARLAHGPSDGYVTV